MSSSSSSWVLTSILATSITAMVLLKIYASSIDTKCRKLENELKELQDELQETIKQNEKSRIKEQTTTSEDDDNGQLLVKRIGTVRSIYRLCVGTPRQGLLAPNARGFIELEKLGDTSTAESVQGLEGYSHIWVIFVFHLNTKTTKRGSKNRAKSKIAPPALGGQKVGILATRTPHRFNPVGITLCKLDKIKKIRVPSKTKKTKSTESVMLCVSGLDLVDGTPVLDIKPYVPVYDSVPKNMVRLPSWVSGGLATHRSVIIEPQASKELKTILENDKNALQFYGPSQGEESTIEETVDYTIECIQQVLAIDVRSSFQTKKARQGKFQAERSGRIQNSTQTIIIDDDDDNDNARQLCTQQLDNLLIQYTVQEPSTHQRMPSEGSGAEDTVSICSIQLLNSKTF